MFTIKDDNQWPTARHVKTQRRKFLLLSRENILTGQMESQNYSLKAALLIMIMIMIIYAIVTMYHCEY